MNAWTLVDAAGRTLRVHQDGVDLRLQLGAEDAVLSHEDRIELARFLLSGVTLLEPVVEKLAEHTHLFEPLPEPIPDAAPKPAHISDGHAFYGRPADPINIEVEPAFPPLKPKSIGRTVVLDPEGQPALSAPQPGPPAARSDPHSAEAAPTIQVKAGPSGPSRPS